MHEHGNFYPLRSIKISLNPGTTHYPDIISRTIIDFEIKSGSLILKDAMGNCEAFAPGLWLQVWETHATEEVTDEEEDK